MGCANTKAGGTAVAEECAPEGGDAQQKDVPKVMVDGDDMAVNGNVVNANGIEESAEDAKETVACNGDLTDSKCQAKTNNEESSKNKDATSPSGDGKSNCANEEAKMADDDETAAAADDDAQIEAADADATNNATDAAKDSSSTTDDKEASESRDNNAGEEDADE